MIFNQVDRTLSMSFNYHYASLFTRDSVVVAVVDEIDANLLTMLRAFHNE